MQPSMRKRSEKRARSEINEGEKCFYLSFVGGADGIVACLRD